MADMGRGKACGVKHRGKVISSGTGSIAVLVDVSAGARSCAGCALFASCGRENTGGGDNGVVLRASVPAGRHVPVPGSDVTVVLRSGGPLRSSVLLFVLPLIVFLILVVGGTGLGFSEGKSAIVGLCAMAIYYCVLSYVSRRRGPSWYLV